MATESGTYTPETIARRLKMAESLLSGEQPVRHWAQGLNELAKGYVGGTMFKNAEDAERQGNAAQYAAIASILGGGQPAAGAAPGVSTAAPSGPAAVTPPAAPAMDDTAPITPKAVPTMPIRQATEGAIIPAVDPYSEDTFRTPLDAMRPDRAAIAAALTGKGAGPAPVGAPAGPAPSPLPPAPTGAMGPPAATPAPVAGIPAAPDDIKTKIAAMLRDPNPYVRQAGAGLANQAISGMIKSDSTENIKNFEYAKKAGFQGSFLDFIQQEKARAGGKFGLQPIWGTDAKGNPVILQLSGTGEAGLTKLPEGVTPSAKNLMKVDTGTEIQMIDPVTRQVVSTTKKDIVGKESAEEVGKAVGTAKVDLPRVEGNAAQALQTIDAIRSHPGKQYGVGAAGVLPGIPGTQQKDFVSLVDQLKGKTFLEAFNSLKGGGAITEAEGKKATDALGRLDRTQSKEGFETALRDLESVIKQGVERVKQRAAMGGTPTAAPAPTDPLGIR